MIKVTDYGAVGDGVSNDTLAFVAALSSGASVVVVPHGRYLIDPITVPAYVTLKGDDEGPFDGNQNPSSVTIAPTILTTNTSAPLITLAGFNSCLSDLLFYYPSQNPPAAASPLVYPHTVSVPAQGGGHFIRRCTFVNSFDAIKINVGRSGVVDCIIGAFRTGIEIDTAFDWVVIDNVWNQVMWDVFAALPFPQNIDTWVLNNSVCLKVGRCDSLSVNGLKAFARYCGMFFGDGVAGQSPRNGYGRLINIDMDYVSYAAIVQSSNNGPGGYKIVNMDAGPNSSGVGTPGQAALFLTTGGTTAPKVSWDNGSVRGLWSVGSPYTQVNSGNASLSNIRGIHI